MMNEGTLIFAAGALAGAVGSLWFIARSVPGAGTPDGEGKRKLAMTLVLAVYAVMALFAAVLGIFLQDSGIAGSAGCLLLLALMGLVVVWQSNAA